MSEPADSFTFTVGKLGECWNFQMVCWMTLMGGLTPLDAGMAVRIFHGGPVCMRTPYNGLIDPNRGARPPY